MTQSFTFQEPVPDLGQGVLPGANMMPPWNQTAAYNPLPGGGPAMLEKPGQKRRREGDQLTLGGLMSNERLSNDSLQRSGNSLPTGGNSFCDDLDAAHSGLTIETLNFWDRIIDSSAVDAYETVEPQQDCNNAVGSDSATQVTNTARYRSQIQQPASSRYLELAAATTAQAIANFHARIEEFRRSSSVSQAHNGSDNGTIQGYASPPFVSAQTELQSNRRVGQSPSFIATENLSSNSDDNISNQTGFESLSGSALGGSSSNGYIRADGETNWPNLTCNASRSLFETTSLGFMDPQSPCTPRGHQQSIGLSDAHQEYLQHMERINSILSDPESPHQNSTPNRRLSYVGHSQEQPASGHSLGFELAPVEAPNRVWRSTIHVDELSSPVPELAGIGVGHVQLEVGCSQSIEPAPVMAPAEPNIGSGERFDLNEVPVGFGDAATPKPSRKKYHPKVAKDKRTNKRRVNAGKKIPASPVDHGLARVNSIKKKARNPGKRASNQCDSTNEDSGRDASHSEVMDMDVEYYGRTSTDSQAHDAAVCDCEACIKLRLEKTRMSQSPGEQHRSWQSTDPGGSSNSPPPVRRSLRFQPPTQALVDGEASGVAGTFLCLSQQINESAAQLELAQRELLHLQNNLSSAIVPAANPPPSCSDNNDVLAATFSNNSTVCPRGILSPQPVSFRDMNQVQRIVNLRSVLKSSLKISPESLLRHIHGHLPESEKTEFEEALWPVVVGDLPDELEKQLRDFAQLEDSVGADIINNNNSSAIVKVRRGQSGSRVKKLVPHAMKANSKAGNMGESRSGRRRKSSTTDSGIISQDHGQLQMVPYENKAVVLYSGPHRKKKNRAKVVLDDETVRVWKLLMVPGKAGKGGAETNAEKELKWEDERRKMKAQALNFIERMHIVMGDRSFSKWKGSVVDSVVGAFLTQNVNDVLSSSAFMSMRSRFPGRKPGSGADTAVAGSFESGVQQHPPPLAPSPPKSNGSTPSSSPLQQPSPQVVTATPQLQDHAGCPPPSVPLLESHESHYDKRYAILAGAGEEQVPPGVTTLDLQCSQKDDNSQSPVLTDEGNTGVILASTVVQSAEIEAVTEIQVPSHGKFNPKTGLTGLERAKKEERQVTASKHLDFSGMQEEFKPRAPGQERPPAPARTEATEDGVDWEAVRRADVAEVADVIKERGLNWILAGRIKAFLERIHLDYGELDLEWLRSMSTDQTKEFLLSIRGLGLKSVECIRLLTLHHLAFPVDTNVGRICVRLGWVPLEPLPEELQLHLLELYPVQATIQKYLWPRLCKFDHKTLYELHYQMISFGKVFCTKTKPNCNACPMRPECKHFASALSRAKLALPASEQPSSSHTILALPPTETVTQETSRPVSLYCQPIIEEPMTPESELEIEDIDIEDYPFSVQELIENTFKGACMQDQAPNTPTILSEPAHPSITVTLPDTEPVPEPLSGVLSEPHVLSEVLPESTIVEDWGGLAAATSVSKGTSFPNNSIEIVDLDNVENPSVLVANTASQEMVVVAPGAASLPVPKLKNVGRLRTVHYVYELPDNHPLLDGLDPRESDDPCTYLLAIWGADEVPESIPNMNDSVNEESGPFASSSSGSGEETIKATLLVPCRTAMRGSFPLNGTYFQVNEVFADHASSLQPMLVPRTLLWNLRRRFVFFGTSVISIFRGMTATEIQACFWRGYVCVRGFDRSTKAPKPLVGRLHLQASRAKGVNADA